MFCLISCVSVIHHASLLKSHFLCLRRPSRISPDVSFLVSPSSITHLSWRPCELQWRIPLIRHSAVYCKYCVRIHTESNAQNPSLLFRSNLSTLHEVGPKGRIHSQTCSQIYWRNDEVGKHIRGFKIYRSLATRVSQLKIWHFWVIGIERNICRCTFNRHSVITQFAKLATGEQLCRRCTHRIL